MQQQEGWPACGGITQGAPHAHLVWSRIRAKAISHLCILANPDDYFPRRRGGHDIRHFTLGHFGIKFKHNCWYLFNEVEFQTVFDLDWKL